MTTRMEELRQAGGGVGVPPGVAVPTGLPVAVAVGVAVVVAVGVGLGITVDVGVGDGAIATHCGNLNLPIRVRHGAVGSGMVCCGKYSFTYQNVQLSVGSIVSSV